MSIQIEHNRGIVDAHITEHAGVAADPTSQQAHMVQLVRQGQDTSLRSLQVWADLARKLGPSALGNPAGATMASIAHDPFEKLLEAQRQVVDELVATQRQLAQQLFIMTATVGGSLTPR
jgi:hypothetical protein